MTTPTTASLRGVERTLWIDFPAVVSRAWFALGNGLTDGVHLLRWQGVGTWAPISALAVGLALPLLHDGPVFTASRISMVALIVIGVAGVQLGFWAWAGYAISHMVTRPDVNRFKDFFEAWLGTPGSTLVVLMLTWLFTVGTGMAILSVRMDLRRRGWDVRYGPSITGALYLVVVGGVVFFLTRATPVLVRPVFTWPGGTVPADAVVPVQSDWWILVLAALISGLLRLWLERRCIHERVIGAIGELALRLTRPKDNLLARWPVWARIAVPAAGLTFLVASLIENLIEGAAVLMFFGGVLTLRRAIVENGWLGSLGAVPILFRFLIGIVSTWAITRIALGFGIIRIGTLTRFNTDSFLIALVGVCLSLGVFIVLMAPRLHTRENAQ